MAEDSGTGAEERRGNTERQENAMEAMPCTYVYVGQLQEARKAIDRALEATDDQHQDGATAAKEVGVARQRIENIYRLHEDGVRS
jgi:hypothetical protein